MERNVNKLSILAQAMMALDAAGKLLGSFDAQGNKRETVALMKVATHLNRAAVESARLMILVAPEGIDPSVFDAAISRASSDAERLEIEAITAETLGTPPMKRRQHHAEAHARLVDRVAHGDSRAGEEERTGEAAPSRQVIAVELRRIVSTRHYYEGLPVTPPACRDSC
jgi:hypothetical protein